MYHIIKYVNKRTTKIQINKGKIVSYQGRYIEKVSNETTYKTHVISSMTEPVVASSTSYHSFSEAYKALMTCDIPF